MEARHGRAIPAGGLSDPFNLKIKPSTTRARPMNLDNHWHKVLGLGLGKANGLGVGVWCLTPTHAVAQSAVVDTMVMPSSQIRLHSLLVPPLF